VEEAAIEPAPYSMEWYRQRALAAEARGEKVVIMRDPKIPSRRSGRAGHLITAKNS
jgi:hypothetical protein